MKPRVLLVDDDSTLRRVLRLALTGLGFQIVEAGSGEAALALLRAGPYDAVLLDIDMPGIDGIETCKEIRKLSRRPAVVMLTVHQSREYKVEASDAGADDYITKPFSFRELVERLRAVVENRSRSEQELC